MDDTPLEQGWRTVEQLTNEFRCSRQTLWQWIKTLGLRGHRVVQVPGGRGRHTVLPPELVGTLRYVFEKRLDDIPLSAIAREMRNTSKKEDAELQARHRSQERL